MRQCAIVLAAVAGVLGLPSDAPYSTFNNSVIFTPTAQFTDPRVLYPRAIELKDGTLLATWENYSPEPPAVYFPIYKSSDHGKTWSELSRVRDTVNNWGLRYQPSLLELRQPFAGFAAGTILLAGNSIPTNLMKTQIDVYASTDGAKTWTFLSHVAAGGEARPTNGKTPVWEPFMVDELILFYSDQRDPKHGQIIAHQTTRDLKTWSSLQTDIAYSDYGARPGMPTTAKLPNGKYILAYEYGGAPGSKSYSYPIHYRLTSDLQKVSSAPDYALVPRGEGAPTSSPFVTWTSYGGANGTILVSAYGANVFANRALGDANAWVSYKVPQPGAYTRNLMIFQDRPDLLLIMGAGNLPPSTTNKVSLSVVDLKKLLG